MSDGGGQRQPAWPAARPSWGTAGQTSPPAAPDAAPPPAEPAGDSDGGSAGGGGHPVRVPWWQQGVDLKLVIAVLIGLVSVTGAAITWRSSLLGEQATDKDRQAVAETVRLNQNATDDQIVLQNARQLAAAHVAALSAASSLDAEADALEAQGFDAAAQDARLTAEDRRIEASRYLLAVGDGLPLGEYIVEGEDGVLRLDAERLAEDLAALSAAADPADPAQTIADAERLREDSAHFDRWLIAMVGAVVLLTLAQVSRARLLRLALTGAGTSVWIIAAALAFGGS